MDNGVNCSDELQVNPFTVRGGDKHTVGDKAQKLLFECLDHFGRTNAGEIHMVGDENLATDGSGKFRFLFYRCQTNGTLNDGNVRL